MPRPKITVFLVLSSLQALAVQQLARGKLGDLLIVNASRIELPDDIGAQIFQLRASSHVGWILSYRRLSALLCGLRTTHRQIDVGIPHAYHLVANFLMYEVATGDLLCLPDGALNLMPIHVNAHHRRKMAIRALIAPLLGMRYRPYHGELHGFTQHRVKTVYTLFQSKFLPLAEETRQINCGHAVNLDRNTCLILDQPVSSIIGKGASLDKIRKRIDSLSSQFSKVIHKMHPNQIKGELSTVSTDATTNLSGQPIEQVFAQLTPGTIIGTASSALFTLKITNPELECIAVGLNLVEAARPEYRHFRAALEKAGARFIDI